MIKTVPVNLSRDPSLPTGIHDPKWKDAAVAARVAFNTYQRLLLDPALFPSTTTLLPDAKAAPDFKGGVDKRTFAFLAPEPIPSRNLRFRGGSYGEIHRRYSFGGRLPAVNFHAQAVIFGADSDGRFFLQATVGRMDGGWGNKASLVVKLTGSGGDVGNIAWTHEMDPPMDHHVVVTGRDPALAAAFDGLGNALTTFFTLHRGS